jgi:acyl carrier protein
MMPEPLLTATAPVLIVFFARRAHPHAADGAGPGGPHPMNDWDDRYLALLHENLPEFPDDATLEADTDLVAAGLDSVQLISLVMALESEYGVTFADEYFSSKTFATPGTVWTAVQELRNASEKLPR